MQNAENLTIIPSSDINKDTEIIFVSCHFDPENISKDGIMKLMDKDGEYRDIKQIVGWSYQLASLASTKHLWLANLR